jgi:hypothetical protein
MTRRRRLSWLFFIGVLTAGSTALGYYYYFFYEPPLAAGEAFLQAMETRDAASLQRLIVFAQGTSGDETLREPAAEDIERLLAQSFHRGRVLEQKKRGGPARDYHYLVYREPDGTIYALLLTRIDNTFKVVLPERPQNSKAPYLWEYTWTN